MMSHTLETEQAKQQRRVSFEQERYAQQMAWLEETSVLDKTQSFPRILTNQRRSREISRGLHATEE